jgi:hypothetical protein
MSEQLSETDELYAISQATNDDGTIDVTLHDFTKTDADDRVSVEFVTPAGDIKSEVMDWPERDSDEYKFVRLFDQTGYGIISAEEACENGTTVTATKNGSGWRLLAPEQQSAFDRMKHKLWQIRESGLQSGSDNWGSFWTMLLMAPFFLFITSVVYALRLDDMNDTAVGYAMAFTHVVMWILAIIGTAMFFGVPLPLF